MTPRIAMLPQTHLIGKQLRMSLADNKTELLWKSFMPRKKEIIGAGSLISLQLYDPGTNPFDLHTFFTKWAGVTVADFENTPEGLEQYTIQGGQYAVFLHKGGPPTFPATIQFIYNDWLPSSGYTVDNREHFELLDSRYRHGDPESEEEVWIPVKTKI